MKKHFMCTHTFHSEESKSAFDAAAQNMTGAQMFAMMKNERAELICKTAFATNIPNRSRIRFERCASGFVRGQRD